MLADLQFTVYIITYGYILSLLDNCHIMFRHTSHLYQSDVYVQFSVQCTYSVKMLMSLYKHKIH